MAWDKISSDGVLYLKQLRWKWRLYVLEKWTEWLKIGSRDNEPIGEQNYVMIHKTEKGNISTLIYYLNSMWF